MKTYTLAEACIVDNVQRAVGDEIKLEDREAVEWGRAGLLQSTNEINQAAPTATDEEHEA